MTVSRRTFVTALSALPFCAVPKAALAHRTKLSYTTLTWNAKTRLLEIEHQIHMHDAERALSRLGLVDQPDLISLRSRAQLALYAERNFSLRALDGTDIAIKTIGADVDGRHAYIFQESALDEAPGGFVVACSLLRDVFDDQVNHVNFRSGDKTGTIQLSGRDVSKKILA